MKYPHQPVMVNEVIASLITDPDGTYVDGTVGSGGHSEAIAKALSQKGRLICVDRDSEVLVLARKRLSVFGNRVLLIHSNYTEIDQHIQQQGIGQLNGVLLDLGLSSYQLEQSGRGFSFNRDEPLDMRMDPTDKTTAVQLINQLSFKEIKALLKNYGEEKKAGLIAKAIDRERHKHPIESSRQLGDLIRSVLPVSHRPGVKDPATRSFQALRIAVNKELDNVSRFLEGAPLITAQGGRMVFLTYHSLEDRLVKQRMTLWEKGCTCPPDLPECGCGKKPLFRRLHKKGIKPGKEEIEKNPRARSATLRAAERI